MRAFACFLGLFLVAFGVVALFTYPAWLLLHPHFDFPFHRIGERIGMLGLAVGFVLVARRLGLADRASLGYGAPRRVFLRELGLGLALGVATMLAVVGIMAALGLLAWRSDADFGARALAKLVAARLSSGLAVAFIEETFLRGAMFTGIQREAGTRTAIVLTAVLYAASHFFGKVRIPADQVTAWSGVDLLAGTLHAFANPQAIADAFLCLAAVGVVLAVVRAATGNIAAGLGLHAGWVWVMLVAHELSQPAPGSPLRFLLSQFDGFVGWLVLAWTVLMGFGLWWFYSSRRGGTGSPAPG
ncbi:MAG: CPBP family glutamic-type intramembrane protease [Steroidobacteraceae bacterium]